MKKKNRKLPKMPKSVARSMKSAGVPRYIRLALWAEMVADGFNPENDTFSCEVRVAPRRELH